MRRTGLAALLLMAWAAAVPAEAQRDDRARLQAYRDSLEAEVLHKFAGRLSHELKLDKSQRAAVSRVLEAGSQNRRELRAASAALYSRLYRAVRSDDTPTAEFQRLLASHDSLRQREHQLWAQEQHALAEVLDPRQRAYFLLAWTRFQDTLREIMSRRPGSDDDDESPRSRSEHHH